MGEPGDPPPDNAASPVTKAVRALIYAVNDLAFGPDPGPHYLFIDPKHTIDGVATTTYEVDYAAGMYVIKPADPPGT